MKIAFWLNNKGFKDVDCSNVLKGNPGIGGSEYSALLIAESLRKRGVDTVILCTAKGRFPKSLSYHCCFDITEACRFVRRKKYDFFLLDSRFPTEQLLKAYPDIKFLAWGNCFIEPWMNEVFPMYPNLLRFVNVGKEQHLLCLDQPIAPKSTYIYNAVPTDILLEISPMPFGERKHTVAYIGSLHRAKGFHLLAKAWPDIVKRVPDAELYVIGSGRLYSRDSKLGKWGIAAKEYEDEFMQYLTDGDKILPSVHFMGVMGQEKFSLLARTKVGVPNPSGVSETFGYTAVEMQFMGCGVTSISCPAYLDTVYDKSNLYSSADDLAEYVCRILNSSSIDYDNTMKYFHAFSVDKVTDEWLCLFNDLLNLNVQLPSDSLDAFTLRIKFLGNTAVGRLKQCIKKIIRFNNG